MKSDTLKTVLAAALFLAASTAWTWYGEWRFAASGETALWFFDVGQGDAIFMRGADGKTMLIDAGPDGAVLEGLSSALPWWDKKIDVIIITHLDADHFGGLFSIISRYEVGEIWRTGSFPTTDDGRRVLDYARSRGVPERFIARGDAFAFENAELRIIHPARTQDGALISEKNEASVVARFICGPDEALLTGDIGFETEKLLAEEGLLGDIEVLKVAHHGSKHSTSASFLEAVRPEYAVLSSGARNRYGHPAPRVLAELLARGTEIHRTDRDGHALFTCGPGGLDPGDGVG